MTIEFAQFTQDEEVHVNKIIERAAITLRADLSSTHKTCPLDLEKLANADLFDFVHDIGGIQSRLNRETGHLTRGFLPRMARKTNHEQR